MDRLIFVMPWFDINWRGFNNTILGRELFPVYQFLLEFFNNLQLKTSHPIFKTGIETLSVVSYSNQLMLPMMNETSTGALSESEILCNSILQVVCSYLNSFTSINFLTQITIFNKYAAIFVLFMVSIMKILFLFLFFLILFLKITNNSTSVTEHNRSIFAMMYESFVLF